MNSRNIFTDFGDILTLIPTPSLVDRYYFICEINTSIKRLTDTLKITPYISLTIKDKDKIIKYISANAGEKTYNKKVDEIKEAITTYKKLNDLNNDRDN